MKIKCWIEAMRLRTLPASAAGVIMGAGCAAAGNTFKWLPVALCLVFAVLAQISSNFANEYYDFKGGLDRKGREGPRRGVTEGDITPRAMYAATFITLGLACCVGLSLLMFAGWWLIPLGIATALGVIAYSAGPYPLSHHGLGEIAVIFFFGIIPVCCTYIMQGGAFDTDIIMASLATGLLIANILIVNNYRDHDDDRAVGKRTLAVILGRRTYRYVYLFNAFAAMALMYPWLKMLPAATAILIPVVFLMAATQIFRQLGIKEGRRLTPLLGMTAVSCLALSVIWAAAAFCIR